ncbi:MAG: substrate-binding domain-containing protein [Chitinivibrionales bacterium]|nr:substrate-binding domain-containing protein [Chitinivibrionales bacterium]
MQSARPVAMQAYQYLKGVAQKLASRNEDAFPSIRAMALRAGVSSMSILRAMKVLKAEGVIMAIGRGRGAVIRLARRGGAKGMPHKTKLTLENHSREYRWEKITHILAEDVLNGAYGENRKLPSYKELHLRFGDCYYTLAKAVKALASSGLIRESGNRYVVTPPARPSRTTVFLFVPEIILPEHISIQDERHRDFLRLVETQCKKVSLNLKIVSINSFNGLALATEYKAEALGAVVYCHASVAKELLDFLVPFDRPIAFIDEWGYYRGFEAANHRSQRYVRFFAAGTSETAAKTMGNMLLGLGHRKIAYISVYGDEQFLFSSQRYRGLKAVFRAAGLREGVTALTSNFYEVPSDHRLFKKSMEDRPDWMGMYESAKKIVPLNSHRHADKLMATLQTISAEEKFRQLCRPLFERALLYTDCTAWVCANDHMAYWAVDFLKAHNKKLPDDLSLVGFDDMFYALQNDITSYNFNTPMLVHRIFQYILNPSCEKNANRFALIEIPGHVMLRGSVAKTRNVD